MSQKFGNTKITCLLCRGLISFKNGDKSRFLDHMNNEHDARYDFDVVLVVSLMTEGEKRLFVNVNQTKLDRPSVTNKPIPDTLAVSVAKTHRLENKLDPKPLVKDNFIETIKFTEIDKVSDSIPNEKAPEREGVLKCKVCSKYVKQSQMEDHKKSHKVTETVIVSKETDDIQMEDASKMALNVEDSAHILSEIPTKDEKDEESPRKQKRKGDDSDDEAWAMSKAKRKPKKSICCRMCNKNFSSNLGLTAHERMAHKERRKTLTRESEESKTMAPEESKPDPEVMPKSPQVTQLPTTVLKTSQPTKNTQLPSQKPNINHLPAIRDKKPVLPLDQSKPPQVLNGITIPDQKPSNNKSPIKSQPSQQLLRSRQSTEPTTSRKLQNQLATGNKQSNDLPTSYKQTNNQTMSNKQTIQGNIQPTRPPLGSQVSRKGQSDKSSRIEEDAPSSKNNIQIQTQTTNLKKLSVNNRLHLHKQETKTVSIEKHQADPSVSLLPNQQQQKTTSGKPKILNYEESLLEEEFDFDDEPQLTIDEGNDRNKTVTVSVVENSKYFNLGDITHTEVLC